MRILLRLCKCLCLYRHLHGTDAWWVSIGSRSVITEYNGLFQSCFEGRRRCPYAIIYAAVLNKQWIALHQTHAFRYG